MITTATSVMCPPQELPVRLRKAGRRGDPEISRSNFRFADPTAFVLPDCSAA